MSAIRPIPVIDGLLAATAVTNDLTLVTRNDRNIAGLGVMVLNPFRITENGRHSTSGFRIPGRATGQKRRVWRAGADEDEHYVYAIALPE